MILGTINAQREAVVPLRIFGANGEPHAVQAILDTGFNSELTLPRALIVRLGLRSTGQRRTILGDASEVYLDVYAGTVTWHSRQRNVLVLCSEDGPFLGMSLLMGSRVVLDVTLGGTITIEERRS